MSQRSLKTSIMNLAQYSEVARSFRRELEAANKSINTIDTYMRAVNQLAAFLAERAMPTDVAGITREHIQEYLADLRSRNKASSVNTRFRSLQQFFNWLVDEGEVQASPMARMKQPTFDVEPPEALSDDQVRKLLKACTGTDFTARRDTAIIRLMYDTGLRRGEVAAMMIEDVDLDTGVLRVLGKGAKVRYQPVGRKAARDLDRYVRARAKHPEAGSPQLWLGRGGPLTASGVYQVVRDRARQAGLSHVHPHQLRHAFAHAMKAGGGSDDDLTRLGGWSSRQMIARYGAAQADERARETHRRLSPGDRRDCSVDGGR
jgi:site-specific recombinase XerD